jgi:hypothetical protein
MLRHIQRFGAETGFAEELLLARMQNLVSLRGLRHQEHFTCAAIDAILDLKDKVDIARLNFAQTKELAERIALTRTPNDRLLHTTAEALRPFQARLEMGREDALCVLADIVLKTREWEAFKWAAPVLRGYMEGRLGGMTGGIQAPAAPDLDTPYWRHVTTALRRREFEFAKQDILFGLDLPAADAAPAQVIPFTPRAG